MMHRSMAIDLRSGFNPRVELNDGSFGSFELTRPHHHIEYNPYFRAWTSFSNSNNKTRPLLHYSSSFFHSTLFLHYLLDTFKPSYTTSLNIN
jgi:hypothetical protein